MPTARPRHTITETDDVADALKEAARRWPEDRDRPAKLIVNLLFEGSRKVTHQAKRDTAKRRKAIEASRGVLTGLYPDGYLDQLRRDWPE